MSRQILHVNMNVCSLIAQSGGVFACCYAHENPILPHFQPVRGWVEHLSALAFSLMDGRREVI